MARKLPNGGMLLAAYAALEIYLDDVHLLFSAVCVCFCVCWCFHPIYFGLRSTPLGYIVGTCIDAPTNHRGRSLHTGEGGGGGSQSIQHSLFFFLFSLHYFQLPCVRTYPFIFFFFCMAVPLSCHFFFFFACCVPHFPYHIHRQGRTPNTV